MFSLCRLDFGFYTGINYGGHEDSPSLVPRAGSTKMGQTARVYLRLSKYPKLSIPTVVEFKFRLSIEKLEVGYFIQSMSSSSN